MIRAILAHVRPNGAALSDAVPLPELLGWYLRKGGIAALRGLVVSAFLGGADLPVFIGGRTTLLYRRRLFLGRGASIGAGSHVNAYSRRGVRLGSRVTIREGAWIQCSSHPSMPGDGLDIGNDTYIGPRAVIGVGGPISIGAGCQIGANFVVVAENHATDPSGRPSATEVTRSGIEIGDSCWIGHGVTILDGVVLGPGCTVGAGAVVTKSFPGGSRIAGVPARPL